MNWNEFEYFQNDPLIPILSFTRKDASFISMIVSKNYRCPIMQALMARICENFLRLEHVYPGFNYAKPQDPEMKAYKFHPQSQPPPRCLVGGFMEIEKGWSFCSSAFFFLVGTFKEVQQ